MTQTLDDSTAILWGTANQSLTWMVLSRKLGTTVVAKVTADHMTVRDHSSIGIKADTQQIAEQAAEAFRRLRLGEDLGHWATHHLEAPAMREIVPNEGGTLL
ncbi:hypothetical protein [Arthrobacter roseus]|uniref:hypothetical protein n=1 Tax=Arthrobacter roseus TaxID=136274 RepID=UPI001964D310|nr:hypothetical protein [Arthrobacter roseus]MBM7847488.1 hypothetical protein [Arthrobacter roseus]